MKTKQSQINRMRHVEDFSAFLAASRSDARAEHDAV
jgi:hypothetical protein